MSFERETLQKADEEETFRIRKGFDKKLVSLALLFATQVFIGTVCMAYRSCDKQDGVQKGFTATNNGAELIIIHITGSVRKPGWFTFEPGARVINAITAAGGVLPNTDFSDVNLARLLKDEEKLVFLTKRKFN